MKKSTLKRLFTSIIIISMIISGININVININAAQVDSIIPSDYSNVDYTSIEAFGKCRTSFINRNEEGYQLVVYKDKLYIEQFDTSWQLKWTKTLELELSLWGGYYYGQKYNYVVCGQSKNSEEDEGGEVYRIIKYDKQFKKIASVSLTSDKTYTSIPFEAGNVSIDEYNNELTVYTSRLRNDGHQSNISIKIDTNNMTLKSDDGLEKFPSMHVSHSFRQIFKYDNGNSTYLDLGDAYPRAVYLQSTYGNAVFINIEGEIGYNETNTTITGLEISDTTYLATGIYYDEVYLASFNKNDDKTDIKWLTKNNIYDGTTLAYSPRMKKIAQNRYVVMWGDINNIKYIIVDENINILSSIKEIKEATISDCEPIFADSKIIWVQIENGFMQVNEISDFSEVGNYEIEDNRVLSKDEWNGDIDTSWYSTSKNEFSISTPAQLAGLSKLVNDGNTFEGKRIELTNDLYMNKTDFTDDTINDWIPIAYKNQDSVEKEELEFNGLFDGNGYSIYNLFIPDDYEKYGGLFGTIGENGVVQCVNVSQSIMCRGGAIASANYGEISGCYNKSYLYFYDGNVGGICTRNYNLVLGCSNYGRVFGSSSAGIVCWNCGKVEQCSNHGVARASMWEPCGIVQQNHGMIEDCYQGGMVSGINWVNTSRAVAGIAWEQGESYNKINNCYNRGKLEIKREADYIWGIWDISWKQQYNNCYTTNNLNIHDDVEVLGRNQKAELLKGLNVNNEDGNYLWVNDSYNINDGYPITKSEYFMCLGIKPNAKVNVDSNTLYTNSNIYLSDFKNMLLNTQIYDQNNNKLNINNTDFISTGCKVKIKDINDSENQYDVIIKGDIDGNGTINVMDMEAAQKHILGIKKLTGVYEQAGLIASTDNISVLDMEAMQKDILGIKKIAG